MEGNVNVTTLVVLSTMFRMLSDEFLFIKGGCPCGDGGCSAGVGWADEEYLADERVFRRCQDNPKVSVLSPPIGTLVQRCVHSEETMGASNGHLVRFTRLLGEGWVRGSVNDGIVQLGVHHHLPSLQLLRRLGRSSEPRCLSTNLGARSIVAT